MTPSDNINSLLKDSPSKDGFSKELVKIVTSAHDITRLILRSDSKGPSNYEYDSISAERSCFKSVLGIANALQTNHIWFKQTCNCVDFNGHFFLLYWTNRDLDFLASITPYKNKALEIVLQRFHGKVAKIFHEFVEIYLKAPSYSSHIMSEYTRHGLSAHPLPPLDIKWAKENDSAEPKVQYLLLHERLRRKTIDSKSVASTKDYHYKIYQDFIKSKGDDSILNGLTGKLQDHNSSIVKPWLSFWLLAMRIRRPMPSLSEKGLGPCLIESFKLEIKTMEEIMKEDYASRKYALECSCLYINYLMACMQSALFFNILGHQDHASCAGLVSTHNIMALKMIETLARRNQYNLSGA